MWLKQFHKPSPSHHHPKKCGNPLTGGCDSWNAARKKRTQHCLKAEATRHVTAFFETPQVASGGTSTGVAQQVG